MNDLLIFNNDEFGKVRTVQIDNEPWFVAKDLTDRLEYQNGSRDIERHVDEEDRQIIPLFIACLTNASSYCLVYK